MRLPSPQEKRPHRLIQLAQLLLLCPADSETMGMTLSQDTPEVDKCSRPHRWTQYIEAQDWMCGDVLDKGQKA